MKRNNPTPFKKKTNPLKSPFRAGGSRAFKDELSNFKDLPTGAIGFEKTNVAGMTKAKDQQFDDFYKNMTNPYADMNMENFAEDLTVNQQQAEFEKQQGMQSEANIMQGMQGAAGGSGVAGLAQAMANQGSQRAQRASASIGQQESANQKMKVQGAQDVQRRRELQRSGAGKVDQMKAQGATAAQGAKAASGMQQAQMSNQYNMGVAGIQQGDSKMAYQSASDARNLQFQKSQGLLQLISGQDAADAANKEAEKSWADRTF